MLYLLTVHFKSFVSRGLGFGVWGLGFRLPAGRQGRPCVCVTAQFAGCQVTLKYASIARVKGDLAQD